MNVYTFMICILLTSVTDYRPVFSRSTYDNPSYNNDRDESLSVLSAHQKKRLVAEDSLREEEQPEEYERNAPLYEGQRYRKYDPETSYARHDNRLEKNRELADFDESKINTQKREYYDAANNPKDASIEVILDPRAKKAVAVVENSPSGQAMYDLSGWKNNKDESAAYDSDQYTPGTQEQVVNLVYPAERNERKYSANAFESNSDYSDKSKSGFKDKLMENDRTAEDTHKRKRNADTKNKSDKENEKRNSEEKSKRKSDQKSDSKSNDCPPHNTPSTMESDSNKNDEESKFIKQQQTVKRETPQWSQQQLDALKNSLAHVNDNSGEVQNLKNILTDMGLINEGQLTKKRETAKMDPTSSPVEKLEEDKEKMNNNDLKADIEDEDLNQDNIILKRNGREVTHEENEEDVNKAPVEPLEKREAEENVNSEEEENEETFDTQDEKKDVKRSNPESEAVNTDAKEETNAKEVAQSREKRQDAETNQQNIKAETVEKSKDIPTSDSEINKNDNSKKYIKRETNSDTSKELRKNRQNQETNEEYEKRMESQIQAKIDAIKEKVKREILEEQFKRRYKRNPNSEEVFRTNARQRRQTKEEMKVIKDSENINKEKSVESPDMNPSETQSKIVRRKRANTLPEKQMVYRAYQADQDEEAEDDSEFDDNAYDGRMYLEKRQTEDENDYFDPVRKREVEGYLQQYYPEARNRRSFNNDGFAEDSNAFHGSRRALKNKSFTGRENQEEYNAKSNENNDSEYFGSLPQSYNGELTRYKRVKRDNPYK